MTKINELRIKIDAVRRASMFNVKEAADIALDCALKIIEEQDGRIARLERIYSNVEVLK